MNGLNDPVFDENLAESLITEDEWHYLDFVPFTFSPPNVKYVDHLETGEHIQLFAQRLSFVYLALTFEYGGQLYIGDAPCLLDKYPALSAHQNISSCEPALIEQVMTDVITSMCGDLTVVFNDLEVLISIAGGFQNAVFGASDQFLNHLKLLATSQGLFLKHHRNETITLI